MARRTERQEPRLLWRGRAMGGSSTINGQIAIRAMPDGLDRWAEMGCIGWGWAEMLPYFCKLETDANFGDAPYHGSAGPIPVYRAPVTDWGSVDRGLREAALALGYGWCDDHNAPRERAYPRMRSTARPAVASRPTTATWSQCAAGPTCGSRVARWCRGDA